MKINQISFPGRLGDSLIYLACKSKVLVYKITGRRWRLCIQNFEESRLLSTKSFVDSLQEEQRSSFSTHLLKILRSELEYLHYILAFSWSFFREYFCQQKVGNLAYPLQKIYIVYQFLIGDRSHEKFAVLLTWRTETSIDHLKKILENSCRVNSTPNVFLNIIWTFSFFLYLLLLVFHLGDLVFTPFFIMIPFHFLVSLCFSC